MNIYHPDKLPPLPEAADKYFEDYTADQMRAYAAAAVSDLQAQVKQLQDTLALQKRSYEREIELDVAAERERCAKLCEAMDPDGQAQGSFEILADKIRAGDTAA